MNDFQTLLAQNLGYKIEEFTLIVLIALVIFPAYYWFDKKLIGIIRFAFLRRTTIAFVAVIIFSIYFSIYRLGRSIEVRDFDLRSYLSTIISFFICFNLYYLLTYPFKNKEQWWVPILNYFSIFLMFWIFSCSTDWLSNYMINSKQSFTDIIIGNNRLVNNDPLGDPLSYENRIFFFKLNVVSSAIIALLLSSIDAGCRYVIKLQQFRKQQKEIETIKIKEQLTKAQLDALHAKVNPHFLYNALNSIAGLALTDGTKTRQMAVSLSKFFRYSINQEQNNLVTLKEELAMVETYLEIEKIRFEDRLNFEIVIQPGLEQFKIPRFILQPVVENSVKHGLKGTRNELFISIQAQFDGNKLALSIQDDGLPFAADMEPGYGLKSVYDKLDLLFPDKYEVVLFNEPVKQVKILIET